MILLILIELILDDIIARIEPSRFSLNKKCSLFVVMNDMFLNIKIIL